KNYLHVDVLIIAGGSGSREIMESQKTLDWLSRVYEASQLTLSICSGSRLLGLLVLLDGKPYCTHHEVYDHMKKIVPKDNPRPVQRFVNTGNIYSSGGISAGIDLSFHIVEKLLGQEIAKKTAAYIEYDRAK